MPRLRHAPEISDAETPAYPRPLPGAEHKTHSGSLARLLAAHRANPSLDVQLVPVSIFVGQSPNRSSGWFSVLFSENWTLVGRFRRILALLLNGRDTLVPVSYTHLDVYKRQPIVSVARQAWQARPIRRPRLRS